MSRCTTCGTEIVRKAWGKPKKICSNACHRFPVRGKKLNEEKVREIRSELTNGVKRRVLAARHGVDPQTIDSIAAGRTWRGIA